MTGKGKEKQRETLQRKKDKDDAHKLARAKKIPKSLETSRLKEHWKGVVSKRGEISKKWLMQMERENRLKPPRAATQPLSVSNCLPVK
jgi:hypothetical protein